MRTVGDIGEVGLLRLLRRRFQRLDRGVLMGIGDDAALLQAVGPTAVLTTDMLIEHVDFERAWANATDIGHKAAAVNLSDLAAMGARPRALLASLALEPSYPVADVLKLLGRLDAVGRRFGAPLVGGDLSRIGGPLVVSVTAVGQVAQARVLRRGGGRIGDSVLVSGSLGQAALGLLQLQAGQSARGAAVRRQLRPEPHVVLGEALARTGQVRACADISDGLIKDALHVVGPGLGVELDVSQLPLRPTLRRQAAALGRNPWQLALSGGEDFELVLAVAPRHVAAIQAVGARLAVPLTVVGRVLRQRGVSLRHGADLAGLSAFDHFGSNV